MNVIKDIAANEAQSWGTLAGAIDQNFTEHTNSIESKQPKGDYATKAEVTQATQDMLTKTEASNTYATKANLNDKVDKVSGKQLSTNDYTNEDKNKLNGLLNTVPITQSDFDSLPDKNTNTLYIITDQV